MNNLKFRAYIKSIQKIVDVTEIDFNNKMLTLDIANNNVYPEFSYWWKETELPFSDVEIMQSTGLFDKNGKEIFEGDIVKGEFYFAGVGYFDTGERDVIVKDKPVLWEDGKFVCCGFDLSEMNEEVEIIGNIYEDKELIENE